MRIQAHFPSDYATARANFLTACAAAGVGTVARVHPHAKGRDGRNLFLDTATIGERDAKKALLLISGTHGVEGYFGSGIQTGLLRSGLAAPKGSKIVLLHALNPYGFAWDRRVNEDNADINRNFVDHRRPPRNRAYESLAEWIAPKSLLKSAWKTANANLRAYSERHGAFALQEAITKGQYAHPDGLYFGGSRESWSQRMLRDVLQEELRDARSLIVIDFHTGLGAHGHGEMISEDLPGSAAYRRARGMWGERVRSSEAGESVSAPLTGTVDKAVARFLPQTRLTFAALEVGTLPARDVFNALRKDNFLHMFAGGKHRNAEAIRRDIRKAFYPDTPLWKRLVWETAGEVVRAAIGTLE
jgi:predicted deacylase